MTPGNIGVHVPRGPVGLGPAQPQAGAGRFNGEAVRSSGFPLAMAGRILAGVLTLGVSELGLALYRRCTQAPADDSRPLGRAQRYLRSESGPQASMAAVDEASDRPGAAQVPVGRPMDALQAQRMAQVERLLGPQADYEWASVQQASTSPMAASEKMTAAKAEFIDVWKHRDNQGQMTIDGWQVRAPTAFARDCINRGEVLVEDGKLVACLQGRKINDAIEHKREKMSLVDTFSALALETHGRASDPHYRADEASHEMFKKNLFSFVQQGACSLFIKEVATLGGGAPANPDQEVIDFRLSADDGIHVRVDLNYNAQSWQIVGPNSQSRTTGPFTSHISFTVPIAELQRADFDPQCITVISADWALEPS